MGVDFLVKENYYEINICICDLQHRTNEQVMYLTTNLKYNNIQHITKYKK